MGTTLNWSDHILLPPFSKNWRSSSIIHLVGLKQCCTPRISSIVSYNKIEVVFHLKSKQILLHVNKGYYKMPHSICKQVLFAISCQKVLRKFIKSILGSQKHNNFLYVCIIMWCGIHTVWLAGLNFKTCALWHLHLL